jgi:hypothetical protein
VPYPRGVDAKCMEASIFTCHGEYTIIKSGGEVLLNIYDDYDPFFSFPKSGREVFLNISDEYIHFFN